MLNRLEMEIAQCKEEAPTILPTVVKKPSDKDYSAAAAAAAAAATASTDQESMTIPEEERTSESQKDVPQIEEMDVAPSVVVSPPVDAVEDVCVTCMPERVALIKSILNFLKKVIPEPTFAENIRNCKHHSLCLEFDSRHTL